MEKRFNFRRGNELTGFFVLGVIALLLVGAIFSTQSQRWFTGKYHFHVVLPEAGASGLRRGDEVFVLGVFAGRVDDILVADNGSVVADLKIRRDFDRFVRVGSVATIKKVFGIAGDSFMEISRGTGPVLPLVNPTIPCLPSEDALARMEKILSDLRAEVMPVVAKAGAGLDEWTKLGADLQKNGEQLRQFVARLGEMLNGVEQGKGTAGMLFTDNTIADEAKHLLLQAKQTVTEIRGVVTNLNTASKSIQAGADRLPEIANAVATETKDLPGLVQQTQTSMREAERLIEAMQHHWLWRKYLNKTNPPSIHPLDASEEPDRNKFKSLRSPKDSR